MKVKIDKPAQVNRAKKFAAPAPLLSSDGLSKKQWYLQSPKSGQVIPGAGINAPGAWKITRGDRKIVVAIIDGGFDLTHPDLNRANKIVFPGDYRKKDNSFGVNDLRVNHGTMCAGVAVAESKGTGMRGVAPGCSFMPVHISPEASDALLIKAFTETALHADVICCSWSLTPVYAPLSLRLYRALKRIAKQGGPRKKGVVICFSASNFNAPVQDPDNHQFFWFDNLTGSFRITRGPILNGYAAHPDIIAVSATTSLNKKAAYSNWGREISICAPSNNFHPLVSSSRLKGYRGIWTTDNQTNGKDRTRRNNGYTGNFGGTSCSTALVAGVAALVLSVNPGLTAAQVKNILQETADKIVDTDPDIVLENKKGDYTNGHSEWFGYGKVNAARAVRLAKSLLEAKSK